MEKRKTQAGKERPIFSNWLRRSKYSGNSNGVLFFNKISSPENIMIILPDDGDFA